MTPKAPATRIALLDDSAICRQQLRAILEHEGDLLVLELDTGVGLLARLEQIQPQVLVTDLVMPGIDGLAVVREVMRARPLPILVVSAGGFSNASAFEATRLGALEVAKKPELGERAAEHALREAVRRLATVPVIRHPGSPPTPARATGWGARPAGVGPRVLGIGSSAGGPPAVAALLAALPVGRAPAILVAQHMPRDHAADFAAFLARRCALEVEVCRGTSTLAPGKVIVPGDGMNLVLLASGRAGLVEPTGSLTPSVDVLFRSLADVAGQGAAGAILSGIGRDGADGLAALFRAGALTMAQDEASCAVFGMPKAAAPSARFVLSPPDMAALVSSTVRVRPSAAS